MTLPLDPLSVPCPKCAAAAGEGCVRLDRTYGRGQPLRKMHRERFSAARDRIVRESARWRELEAARRAARGGGEGGRG